MNIYSDICFKKPLEIIKAFDNEDFKTALNRVEELSKNYYLLGYIRYEAKDIFLNKIVKSKQPLLYFEAYETFEKYVPENKMSANVKALPTLSFEEYAKAIKTIKEEIASGNTYEVNYTYDWDVKTDADSLTLYETLLKRQKTSYNTFIKNEYETLLYFSPELFFELENGKILTKPMKGTIKRGATEQADKQHIEFLKNDIKNRAENVMIVDLLRNDLGRIAKTGTVKVPKLFEIETHKTLHQMTSTITAELLEGTTLYDVFEAIFPCGSITGAPKISTMEIIDRVETGKRNIYCGAIGFLSPQKAIFSVPIRILQKTNQEDFYKYRVGGAIVWDSDIKDEWEETVTKMSFLNTNNSLAGFKIIETIKVENSQMLYKKEHFERMKNTAKHFGFIFPESINDIVPEKDGMLRVLLSCDGSFETEYKPLIEHSTNKIEISAQKVNSKEQFLYHKTTNRPWYKAAFERIKAQEVYDVIFLNEKDELTEGARTNILLQIDGRLYTPKISSGLLNGVMRRIMLEQNKCEEKVLTLNDLNKAQKIFCINSVRGIVEVTL